MALVHSKPTEKLSVIRKIGDITKAMLSGHTEFVQREVYSLVHYYLLLNVSIFYKLPYSKIDFFFFLKGFRQGT